MARVEMVHVVVDLDRVEHRRHSSGEEEGSFCFSDAEEGSCCSQFYSTVDDECGSYGCDSEIAADLEEGKVQLGKIEKDCRICHLNLESSGVAIELGCCCKGDLASAHKHCAETWFKIKGNKICEICNTMARNVVGPNDSESEEQQEVNEINGVGRNATTAASEAPRWWSSQKFLNFLLACMVFAFVISGLFHFTTPSAS